MSARCVVILFADSDRAEGLANLLVGEGMQSIVVSTSDQLYHTLNTEAVSAVVIDQELNSFLSGLEILERLAEELLRPATILVGEVPPRLKERAARMSLGEILPSETPVSAIRDIISGNLFSQHSATIRIPHRARALVAESPDITPMPQLVVRLFDYLKEQSDIAMDEFARELSCDARVTADLLKFANSSSTGVRNRITSVFDAVKMMGIRRACSLVLTSHLMNADAAFLGKQSPEFGRWYHTRSVLVGATASAVATHLVPASAELAYVLGLLQNVGILLLTANSEQRYHMLIEHCRNVPHLVLSNCERQEFLVTHNEVAASVIQKWELPGSFVRMAVATTDPAQAGELSELELKLVKALRIAEAFANMHDNPCPQRNQHLNRLFQDAGISSAYSARSIFSSAVGRASELSRLLNIPLPPEEEMHKLLEQVADTLDVDLDTKQEGPSSETTSPAASPSPAGGCSTGNPSNKAVDLPGSAGTNRKPDMVGGPQQSAVNDRLSAPPAQQSTRPNPAPARPVTTDSSQPSPSQPRHPRHRFHADSGLGQEKPNRVLIVEDNDAITRLVTRYLESVGFEVLECRTASTAVQLVGRVSAVLCDIHLGHLSGMDVVRSLRQHGFEGAIIAISGDRRRTTVVDSIQAGVVDYLVKPFSKQQLFEKLARHMSLKITASMLEGCHDDAAVAKS